MYARAALLVCSCIAVLTSTLQAVSPEKLRELRREEIKRIEEAMPSKPTVEPAKPRKLLVFWRCEGFYHACIPVANKALEIMGKKTRAFEATFTDDYSVFTRENLRKYDAICLNNTTGLKFNPVQTPERCKALMDFVKSGKGIAGIHAATDNFNEWPEAREMMGGKFTGHPWGGGGTWAIKIDEPGHPLMAAFEGKGFKIKDEIYRTDPPLYSRGKQRVLMSLDMSDPTTRNVDGFKPTDSDTGISWVKTLGKGRVFYCSLGHNNDIFWNPAVLQHYLDGIQFAFGDYRVDTKPMPLGSSGKGSEMEQLLEKVKTYDWGQSRVALTDLSELIRKAHGDSAELKKIEQGLLGVLKSDAKYAGKQYACRELSIIGTEESVPTLGKMLTDPELADMARYALERVPGKAVDRALRRALRSTSGKTKIGIVNSLGERRDRRAVAALSKLVSESDKAMAAASASALGKIGGSEAAKALAKAKDQGSGKLKMVVLDAYLRCADQFAAEGNKKEALAIYRQLYKQDQPQLIRTAAMRGIANAAGGAAKPR
jgi:type 1 glutamine amidotransferase